MKNFFAVFIVSLLFAFLFTFSVVMHFLWKSLIKSKYTSIGVIEKVKTKTSNGSTWHTPTVTYCVDGKTYTNRSCMSKIHSFEKGQKINVRYLKRFPRFSVVCDNTGYLSKPFFVFCMFCHNCLCLCFHSDQTYDFLRRDFGQDYRYAVNHDVFVFNRC